MTEVTYTVADGIAHIELNRPESANTIDMPLALALGEAATNAAEDDTVRAVVLSGAGARFCGGGDVAAFHEAKQAIIRRYGSDIHLSFMQG